MRRVAYIIPGYKHLPDQKEYQQIGRYFKEVGIEPIYITIVWNRTTLSQNLTSFLEKFNETKGDKNYVLGFSFGAVISFIASAKIDFDLQILCSLSPYFKEDLPKIKKWWVRFIGKRRYQDFYSMESINLAKKLRTSTVLIYGSAESFFVKERAEEVFNNLRVKKELLVANNAKHDLSDPEYQKVIKKLIFSLK